MGLGTGTRWEPSDGGHCHPNALLRPSSLEVRLDDLWRSLPTQTIWWLYDLFLSTPLLPEQGVSCGSSRGRWQSNGLSPQCQQMAILDQAAPLSAPISWLQGRGTAPARLEVEGCWVSSCCGFGMNSNCGQKQECFWSGILGEIRKCKDGAAQRW